MAQSPTWAATNEHQQRQQITDERAPRSTPPPMTEASMPPTAESPTAKCSTCTTTTATNEATSLTDCLGVSSRSGGDCSRCSLTTASTTMTSGGLSPLSTPSSGSSSGSSEPPLGPHGDAHNRADEAALLSGEATTSEQLSPQSSSADLRRIIGKYGYSLLEDGAVSTTSRDGGSTTCVRVRDKHRRQFIVKECTSKEEAEILRGSAVQLRNRYKNVDKENHFADFVAEIYKDNDANGSVPFRSILLMLTCGSDLRRLLNSLVPPVVPISEALLIVTGVAAALDFLHGRDVVHCAVRPEHILIDRASVRLCGLSGATSVIAKLMAPDEFRLRSRTKLAVSPFLAPEASRAEAIDPFAADVYAAGVLLRLIISGNAVINTPHLNSTADDASAANQLSTNGVSNSSGWQSPKRLLDLSRLMTSNKPSLRPMAAAVKHHPWLNDDNISGQKRDDNTATYLLQLFRSGAAHRSSSL